ncbi:hypothetical protein [Salmonella enterica]|uniref:hypothetical protein n=1 Tax=Salmonella enterica TaxID=28901 RepID=UPI00193E56F4|nr:hypothetical protein [Salmonella enterica]EEN5587743.1 hypothetical protein [Salmonella enterica subsp. enterica serovar Mountpleasant]
MTLQYGWGKSDKGLKDITQKYNVIILESGENESSVPDSIKVKLNPQNSTGLGSTTAQGIVLNTQAAARTILNVVNTYLTDKLTADEMAWILSHRDKFTFSIGVGDRRTEFISRFALATNWHGEDVTNFQLRPNPAGAPEYDLRLTFSASAGTMTVTDNHVGTRNTYGSLRYFAIRMKSNESA